MLSQVTLGRLLNLALVICETGRLMTQNLPGLLGGLHVIIYAKCSTPATEEMLRVPSACPRRPFCRERAPPVAKVMRKEAWHTQRRDQASGIPLEILEHLPPKPESAYFLLCALTCLIRSRFNIFFFWSALSAVFSHCAVLHFWLSFS